MTNATQGQTDLKVEVVIQITTSYLDGNKDQKDIFYKDDTYCVKRTLYKKRFIENESLKLFC